MAAVSGEALAGFGHEDGRDAVFGRDGFDGVFEQAGAVGDFFDFAEFKRLAREAIGLAITIYNRKRNEGLTASKTPGPLSVCQLSMLHLKSRHVLNTR